MWSNSILTDKIGDKSHHSGERIGRHEHGCVAELYGEVRVVLEGAQSHVVFLLHESQLHVRKGSREPLRLGSLTKVLVDLRN